MTEEIAAEMVSLIWEGIREGAIHQEGSAEAQDAQDALSALDAGRLLGAAADVSGLVRPNTWDRILELAAEAGFPDRWEWPTDRVFPEVKR